MATSAGEIEVALTLAGEGFKKSLGDVEDKLGGFEKGVKTLGTAIAAVFSAKQLFDFAKASFMAFGEQEAAVVKLNQALANFGLYSEKTTKGLQDYAAALQSTTVYADEQIIAIEAQLTAFGLQGKQLKEVTKSTLDLASAKGMDLASAAQLLGKAFVGETGMLARYGIVVDDSVPKHEKFAAVMAKVNGMFGGQAEKERMTAIGQLKGMQNTFNDLQETIGSLIAGPATAIMRWLVDIIKNVNAAIQTLSSAKDQAGSFANFVSQTFILAITAILQTIMQVEKFVADMFIKYITMIPGLSTALATIGVNITTIQAQVTAGFQVVDGWIGDQGVKLQGLVTKWIGAGNTAVATEAKKKEAAINYHNATDVMRQQAVDKDIVATEAQGKAWEKYYESLHATHKVWADMFTVTNLEVAKKFAGIVDNMFSDFGRAMADVIVDSKNFSDALKQVWKSLVKALISEIITLIAKLIVALALKSALGLGGASVGAAAANIASLTQLAGKAATGAMINEPSLVTGLKSGKTILAGEAGPEAIIPTGGGAGATNKTASQMGMDFSGGGGGVSLTINIQGQFLEANENTWQRMFREKILPEIKRVTMTNPTGNFIRRRGATA